MAQINTVTYQCPNCSGALEYDMELKKFRCKFCDGVFTDSEVNQLYEQRDDSLDLENAAPPELDDDLAAQEEFSGQSALYSCPNCGAGVICDKLQASTRCHFCHTPVVLTGRLSGEFKPDVIIPFAITETQAKAKFYEYIKGMRYLPGGFSSQAQINNLSALYVPYWLKSGLVDADLNAVGKIVKTWRSGDRRYTNVKEYRVGRTAEFAFIRVPCDGSRRIEDALMESIEPFSYGGLKPFQMSYLSGCAAEKYDVDKQTAGARIDERVKVAAEAELRKTANVYTSLSSVQSSARYRNSQFVYAMLPVWFLNYQYKGEDYSFVINGQTGMTFGRLPISKAKLALGGALRFLIIAVLVFLIGGFLFGMAE